MKKIFFISPSTIDIFYINALSQEETQFTLIKLFSHDYFLVSNTFRIFWTPSKNRMSIWYVKNWTKS